MVKILYNHNVTMANESRVQLKTIKMLQKQEEMLLVQLGRAKNKIPKDIAANRPLRENLLSLFICIYSHTPLFICGKPGSSKTISVNIIKNIFSSKHVNNSNPQLCCFRFFRTIRLVYYQGSVQSTDEGIERVFTEAQKKLHNKVGEIPLVFFDEIGLAELSPYNPLKVLHKYLEYMADDRRQEIRIKTLLGSGAPSQPKGPAQGQVSEIGSRAPETQAEWGAATVPFVGISNWTIDVSKMNRNIYLSRPNPEFFDLFETGQTILIHEMESLNGQSRGWYAIPDFSALIAETYFEFRAEQYENFPHKSFHSLRDYYWVLKNSGKHFNDSKNDGENFQVILESLYKNFSGFYYLPRPLTQAGSGRARSARSRPEPPKPVHSIDGKRPSGFD